MIWLVLSLLLPFITAVACLRKEHYGPWVPRLSLIGAIAQLGSGLMLVNYVLEHQYVIIHVGAWAAPFGITLVADLFSAMMVLISAVIAVAVALYSMGDIDQRHTQKHYYSLIHLLLMGVNGSFLTGDLYSGGYARNALITGTFLTNDLKGSTTMASQGFP